jgi:hypothetical protein
MSREDGKEHRTHRLDTALGLSSEPAASIRDEVGP